MKCGIRNKNADLELSDSQMTKYEFFLNSRFQMADGRHIKNRFCVRNQYFTQFR